MKSGVIHFKHSYNTQPITLMIKSQPTCCQMALSALLPDYLALWGNRQGALFLMQQGTAMTHEAFNHSHAIYFGTQANISVEAGLTTGGE